MGGWGNSNSRRAPDVDPGRCRPRCTASSIAKHAFDAHDVTASTPRPLRRGAGVRPERPYVALCRCSSWAAGAAPGKRADYRRNDALPELAMLHPALYARPTPLFRNSKKGYQGTRVPPPPPTKILSESARAGLAGESTLRHPTDQVRHASSPTSEENFAGGGCHPVTLTPFLEMAVSA